MIAEIRSCSQKGGLKRHPSATLHRPLLSTESCALSGEFYNPLNGSAVAHFEGEPFLVAGHLPESYRFRFGSVTASRRI